jgi:negative regulator of sigma E activity
MTNIPPVQQPIQLPPVANNTVQIAIGAIVTLATIMGTRLTTGNQVENVRTQAGEIQQEMLRLSQANQSLNLEIKTMAVENKRLNELAIELGKKSEERQNALIRLVEGLKR